jgi:mannose-1-phosphate guanylyltransferase
MISVILCGGAGSRLWPVSRELHPKPFLRLKDGQSLIQKAFLRGAAAPEAIGVMTVTNSHLYFKVAEEYVSTGLHLDASYVLEPFGRNTGPAIALAALRVRQCYGENEPMLILPADHLIPNLNLFSKSVSRALELAKEGRLATFGILPTSPETGFGYIETDGERVVRFVEKPTLAKAREYVESGRFVWNSGMFCFKAGVLLTELAQHAPELLAAAESCFAASTDMADKLHLEEESFARIPAISIDYSVFEKSVNVAAVHGGDFGWNDIGSWTELCGFDEMDANGNRISEPSEAVLHDCHNCDINNRGRLVAALGIDNLLVVDTADALLIADKSRAQDVKIIYNRLKEANHEAYKHHRTIYRPWGSFTLLESSSRFKIKRLMLKPGATISLQRHYNRSEHWIVVSGMAEVTCDDRVFFVNPNESTYIKAGANHRVGNPGKVDLVLIEVQSGDYLGEDDIVRFEDAYGRV